MNDADLHMLKQIARDLHQHFCGGPHGTPVERINHIGLIGLLQYELQRLLETIYGPFEEDLE